MSKHQHEAHTYPLKKHWQYINQFGGFWSWLCLFGYIVGFPYLLLFFKWERKVFPAFRNMMDGEPRSYLRVSDNGLIYRNWPWFEVRCKWEDVKRINIDSLFGDTLHLQRAEQIGFPEFTLNLSPPQIHLSSLVGWKEGELKDDLRQYAPQLFNQQS